MPNYSTKYVHATTKGPQDVEPLKPLFSTVIFDPGTPIAAGLSSAPKKVKVPNTGSGVDLDWVFVKWDIRTLNPDGKPADKIIKYKPDPSIQEDIPVPSPAVEMGTHDIILYAVYSQRGGPHDDDPAVVLSAYDVDDQLTVLDSSADFFRVTFHNNPLDIHNLNLVGGTRVLVTTDFAVDITRFDSVTAKDLEKIYTFSSWEVTGGNSEAENGEKNDQSTLSYKQKESPVLDVYYSSVSTKIRVPDITGEFATHVTILIGSGNDGTLVVVTPGGVVIRIPPRSPAYEILAHIANLEKVATHEAPNLLQRLEDTIRQVTRRLTP